MVFHYLCDDSSRRHVAEAAHVDKAARLEGLEVHFKLATEGLVVGVINEEDLGRRGPARRFRGGLGAARDGGGGESGRRGACLSAAESKHGRDNREGDGDEGGGRED